MLESWSYISTIRITVNGLYREPRKSQSMENILFHGLVFLWPIYSPKIIKKWSLYIYHYFKNHGLNIFRFPGLHGLLKEKTSFLKPFKILLKRL